MKEEEYKYPKPRSRFLKMECTKCGEEQIVFGSAAGNVECNSCGELLVESTGGKAKARAKIKKVLG